jgi:hypothetical protein
MATYSPSQLGFLLQQWGSGNLDNIISPGHIVSGVPNLVLTGHGFKAMGLAERFTNADIEQAITSLMVRDRGAAVMLIAVHLLGWTMERLGRALEHSDTSYTQTALMLAEGCFMEVLLNAN